MRSYHAARAVFSLFSTLAWIIILLGVAVALIGISRGHVLNPFNPDLPRIIAGVVGAVLAMFGLVMLVLAQTGRAGVDTAEYSQQMLKASRDHMEVSQQLVRQGEKLEQGYAALASKFEAASTMSYAGRVGVSDAAPVGAPAAASLAVGGAEAEPAKLGYGDRLQLENGAPLVPPVGQAVRSESTA